MVRPINPQPSPQPPARMNPLTWFRNSINGQGRPSPHMTWATPASAARLAHRPVPQTPNLDLADHRRRAALADRLLRPPVDRNDDARRPRVATANARRPRSGDARNLVPGPGVERRVAGQQRRHPPDRSTRCSKRRQATRQPPPNSSPTLRAKLDKSLGPALTAHDYVGLPRRRQEEADRRLGRAETDRPAGHSRVRLVPHRARSTARRTSPRRSPASWR